MKRLRALALVALLSAGLAGCGSGVSTSPTSKPAGATADVRTAGKDLARDFRDMTKDSAKDSRDTRDAKDAKDRARDDIPAKDIARDAGRDRFQPRDKDTVKDKGGDTGAVPEKSGPPQKQRPGDPEESAPPAPPGAGKRETPPRPQVWHREGKQPSLARVYVGEGNSLELVSQHVTVTLDGPRARTLVDHVFRNPHDRTLEGTFEYPLPTGASPCYFAMFLGRTGTVVPPRFGGGGKPPPGLDELPQLAPAAVARRVDTADWGPLQEAKVVSREKALETYEDTIRRRIDPALLEYAGGNTFSGRVFPIPPRGYNRVLIAYEELLPVRDDRQLYRFPLPGRRLEEMSFTLQVPEREAGAPAVLPRDLRQRRQGDHLVFERTWKDDRPEGEVLFSAAPPRPTVQAISGRDGDSGACSVYARLRPDLKAERAAPFASTAVFLLDTSLSEHPDRFAVSMRLLRAILEGDPDIRRFNVLTFSVGATWVEPGGFLANTPEGRKAAFDRLDGLALEGATDLGAALDRLCAPDLGLAKGAPVNCFLLSDGQLTWGETDVAALVGGFERRCPLACHFHCYRTGLGADNAELFDALTARGGGVFQCYGEADVAAAAQAHRHDCWQVTSLRFAGGPAVGDVLVAGRRQAVYPGGELVVVARAAAPGRTRVVIEGTFQGKPLTQEFAIDVTGGSELAARGWAEVAVASLQAFHDPKLDGVITAYCQRYNLASRAASFLVLDNEAGYAPLNLEAERRQALPGDVGDAVEALWDAAARARTAAEDFRDFLDRVEPRIQARQGPGGQGVRRLLDVLGDGDFVVPARPRGGALVRFRDLPAAYREGRERDRRDPGVYLEEARRRADGGDSDGAVRVLSSIVEESPTRGDALRLVGYRLLDLGQPADAARLFGRVQRQRPFEPHSYRDLARSLEDCGRDGFAALNYELLLAGTWNGRFGPELKEVAREEYARLLRDALRRGRVSGKLGDYFAARLEQLRDRDGPSDLRVTITWNTDDTDIDLWVTEPDGTEVYYGRPHSRNGGELSADQRQGYGPERYLMRKAPPGEYVVRVHYYAGNPRLLGGETHVQVAVTRFGGSERETTERRTVVLKEVRSAREVCRVRFGTDAGLEWTPSREATVGGLPFRTTVANLSALALATAAAGATGVVLLTPLWLRRALRAAASKGSQRGLAGAAGAPKPHSPHTASTDGIWELPEPPEERGGLQGRWPG